LRRGDAAPKLYLPPYRAAIKAGVGSIMVSYSSWNGVKMHGNQYLLTDVLKNELGFRGFLVSDWAAIDQISPDYKKPTSKIHQRRPGHDHDPQRPGQAEQLCRVHQDLKDLVAPREKLPPARIDDAVRRILRIKFQTGFLKMPTPIRR
jgi:beta-glucosidase